MRPSSATRPSVSSAAPRRPTSTPYTHPYLPSKPASAPPRRELGLCDLLFVKVLRCFVADDMPPPDPAAPVFQADKEKSSATSVSLTTTTTATATTATTGTAGSTKGDPVHKPPRKFVMPEYNKPPPEPVKPRVVSAPHPTPAFPTLVGDHPKGNLAPGFARFSAPAPLPPPRNKEEADLRNQTVGKVNRLSSMFENPDG